MFGGDLSRLKPERILNILAVITICYWLSMFVYLPPFANTPDFDNLASQVHNSKISEAIKATVPELDIPREELAAQLKSEHFKMQIKQYVMYAFGLLSGVLIYLRRRLGKYIAVFICLGLITIKLWSFASSYPNITDRIALYFTILLPNMPVVILHDLFGLLFALATIFLLFRKQVSLQLERII